MDEFDGLNPFRPGPGSTPLYLAGRTKEQDQFRDHLTQRPILQNVILTGLRGVGKSVLLQTFKPIAQKAGWLWTGNDLSEAASLTEETVARRLVTDLSALLGPVVARSQGSLPFGFSTKLKEQNVPLKFDDLWDIYEDTPGLTEDKIKAVLKKVRSMLNGSKVKGVVFAYDEAQNLSDHSQDKQYPLSILLDVFSSLQRDHTRVPLLLVLTGLPTLFPKLNEARTYTERMFTVMQLSRLSEDETKMAVLKPIEISHSPLNFSGSTVQTICDMSVGYPFFVQYICKEVFDTWFGQIIEGDAPSVPMTEILAKLDQDFFSPRWHRATPRQQEFMFVMASVDNSDGSFTAPEISKGSKDKLEKGFSPSHSIQLMGALIEKGLVYRNNRNQYSFAVPLMAEFIRRQPWVPLSSRD